jgi:hypothetical protein
MEERLAQRLKTPSRSGFPIDPEPLSLKEDFVKETR